LFIRGLRVKAIHVRGGKPLYGKIKIQGSKNAALPVLAACLLIKGTCLIRNCPDISDVNCMLKLLQCTGCSVERKGDMVVVNATSLTENRLPKEYVGRMRSSVILMGPLLARTGAAVLDYPGGCVIGDRPIDFHVEALKQLGVFVENKGYGIRAFCKNVKGNRIIFPFPSVGATQNAIMAAVLADGVTILENCAKEPEVVSLCNFLIGAGAKIDGVGEAIIRIEGVESLHATEYEIESDRIVAGTYLFSCIATGGEITLEKTPLWQMQQVIKVAKDMGACLWRHEDNLCVKMDRMPKGVSYLKTDIYPGFPTDLQSALLVALSSAEGKSHIHETIFNNRYRCVPELNRMGAQISISGRDAYIEGMSKFRGGSVVAQDLRGGAALVMAALLADADSFISNYDYIDRGYEDICRDFRLLGADVKKIW